MVSITDIAYYEFYNNKLVLNWQAQKDLNYNVIFKKKCAYSKSLIVES